MSCRAGLPYLLAYTGCLALACGAEVDGAEDRSWPPVSLGGQRRVRGPTEDLDINPETYRAYEDEPDCGGQSRVVGAARSFARWEGTLRCLLSSSPSNPPAPASRALRATSLQLDVRLAEEALVTCEWPPGNLIQAKAVGELGLSDAQGATLEESTCSGLASAWPGSTNLQLRCADLTIDLRADHFFFRSGIGELAFYEPQCQRVDE
jgi:hypothetical protein